MKQYVVQIIKKEVKSVQINLLDDLPFEHEIPIEEIENWAWENAGMLFEDSLSFSETRTEEIDDITVKVSTVLLDGEYKEYEIDEIKELKND